MPPWLLVLTIPTALVIPCCLLALSAFIEQRALSPRSMILSAAKARHTAPEFAEALVAREFERLLKNAQT